MCLSVCAMQAAERCCSSKTIFPVDVSHAYQGTHTLAFAHLAVEMTCWCWTHAGRLLHCFSYGSHKPSKCSIE